MSSNNLDTLIKNLPEDRETVERFLEAFNKGLIARKKYYSISRIYDLVGPASYFSLASLLAVLATYGMAKKRISVESSKSDYSEHFYSLEKIPDKIHDLYIDRDVDITPDDIHVEYEFDLDDNT